MNSIDLMLRMRALVSHDRVEQDLRDELRAHFDIQVARNMQHGMSKEEAEQSAQLLFGNYTLIAEQCREQRGVRLLEDLAKDVNYGARQLVKQRGFTIVAVLTLALGIGANTAIFSTVEGVLLRPFPYREPDRLTSVWSAIPSKGIPQMGFAIPDLRDLTKRNRSFDTIAGYFWGDANLGDGRPERVSAVFADASLFPTLGVRAALGRTYSAAENAWGAHHVVLISDALWKRRFGGRADATGQWVHVNEEPYRVVGVMAPDFQFPDRSVDLWMPMAFSPGDDMATRDNHYVSAIARLKPGIGMTQARSDVQRVGRDLEREFNQNSGISMDGSSYLDSVVGDVRQPLLLLQGAVGVVLMIACVNVANLLLARASARQTEFAVRSALGASRGRLVRQLLSENLLLGATGATLGVALSLGLVHLIRVLGPEDIPRLQSIGVDGYALAFTAVLALSSVLIFGLVPALHSAPAGIGEALKDGGRSQSAGTRTNRSRNALVVAEIAMSLVLVIGAGLVFRTSQRLSHVDPGFKTDHLLTFSVSLPATSYPESDSAKVALFHSELIRRLEQIPGVQSAGASTSMPITHLGGWGKNLTDEEHPAQRLADVPLIQFRQVTPHYLRAMGIPVREGRFFTESDTAGQPLVAVINEAARRRFFPHASPIGKRIHPGPPEATIKELLPTADFHMPRLSIVGVIGDIRHFGLAEEPMPELFVAHMQGSVKDNQSSARNMYLFVRTMADPKSYLSAIRSVVRSMSPNQPIADIATMDERLATSLARQRFQVFLFGGFAIIALLLACVGIYGVMTYSVRLRTPEIGIRIALGANPMHVLRLVVVNGLRLALIGILVGTALAFGVTRLLKSLLFGVQATDLSTFVGASCVLIASVAVACLIPSWRATRINPLSVLRAE